MKRVFAIVVVLSLVVVLGLASAAPITAVQAPISVEVTNPIAWELSDYIIQFKNAQLLLGPADYIDIMFPTDTDLGTVTSVNVTTPAITTTYTVIGNSLRIRLADGEAIEGGADVAIVVAGVTNPGPCTHILCVGTSTASQVCSDESEPEVVATHELTMAADSADGGTATDVTGESPYRAGAVVGIRAEATAGYRFVKWTAAPEVEFEDAGSAETTFVMPDEAVTVTASFVAVRELTISSTSGGRVTAPGEGEFIYDAGEPVGLAAEADEGYDFVEWTGSVDAIADPESASTTIIVDGDYSLTASFEETPPVATGCFIATAVYGTPGAEQIDVLRGFRDVVLMESEAGSRFVTWYYRTSPAIAEFLAGSELLRTFTGEFLVNPVAWMVEATATMWQAS